VPKALAAHTVTLNFNDADQVREVFGQIGDRIACLIVEPVAGNMNCVTPAPGFLQTLREVCDRAGAILIFDEVMTGFRVALGGAQELYGVRPDLTTLGKIIGGGMPVGAFGVAATSWNGWRPWVPSIRRARCRAIRGDDRGADHAGIDIGAGVPRAAGRRHLRLMRGLEAAAADAGVPLATNHVCGMFGLFFTDLPAVNNFADVMQSDVGRFKRFFHAMLEAGVYLAPSAFEAGFLSAAHSAGDIEETVAAAARIFPGLRAA